MTQDKMPEVYCVSACLLGFNCKYSGGNNQNKKIMEYLKDKCVISVCPEVLGGLPIPRLPGEIVDGVVKNKNGNSVDREYRRGAQKALEVCKNAGVSYAILQSRSPSCGVDQIYDGTFSGVKKQGHGIFAELLINNGIEVIDSSKFE